MIKINLLRNDLYRYGLGAKLESPKRRHDVDDLIWWAIGAILLGIGILAYLAYGL